MDLPLLNATIPASDHRPAPAGTLAGDAGALPLVAMTVDADVVALTSSLRVVQRFRNTLGCAIEATYVFPLPDRSAVIGFSLAVGERRLEGVLMERGEARAAYDQAIAEGYRAATAEEERPDVFTTRVGNLQPGEEAEVELRLVGPLACEDGEATFRVPLVVAPRYVPGSPLEGPGVGEGTEPDTDVVPDASRITPPRLVPGAPNPLDLAVTVRIDPAGLNVSDLRSSLHALAEGAPVAGALDGPVTVRLRPGERLDRDFLLRFRAAGEGLGVGTCVTPDAGGDEGTLCVTVLAPQAPGAPRRVAVVLDRSGSMGGWKMVAARRAAARIVDSLGPHDRFCVLAFDDQIERPTGQAGLVAASDRNRFRAVQFLATLEARGGTEMHAALDEALGRLGANEDDGAERTCILVTDGQVADGDRLVLAAAARPDVRIYTVGIDRAVNAGLLQRLAATGGGRCDLVESEDRLDHVLTGLHRRLSPPALRDVGITSVAGAELLDGSATPAGLADAFAGVPLLLWARYRGRPERVTVATTDASGRRTSFDLGVVATPSAAAAPSWARALLRDLEDRYAASSDAGRRHELEQRIVATSLRHQVLTRFTAFVVVDRSERTSSTRPHHVIQPVEQPSGWDLPLAGARLAAAAPSRVMRRPAAVPPGAFSRPGYRSPLSGELPDEAAPAALALDGYRRRTAELLEAMAAGTPVDLLADLAQLVDDLVSVGAGQAPLAEALEALATALASGDPSRIDAAINAVRDALNDGIAPSKAFWR